MTAEDKWLADHFSVISVGKEPGELVFDSDGVLDDLADREEIDLIDDDSAERPQQ